MIFVSHIFVDVKFVTFQWEKMRNEFLRVKFQKALSRINDKIFGSFLEILYCR